MRAQTYMSVVDKYLLKHAKGEMITQKMLQQSCHLTASQASRYISYCIRIGLGTRTKDGLGFIAIKYTPDKDQRVKQIALREDANNKGKKRGVKRESYVKTKLKEMADYVERHPPKPYVPPPVYAADPVMLEKLDIIASGLAHISKQLELLNKVWA